MFSDKEEASPLISNLEDQTDYVQRPTPRSLADRVRASWVKILFVGYTVAVSVGLICAFVYWKPAATPYTPAQKQIEYETVSAKAHWHELYSKSPSPEVDDAWDKLVSPIYFSATPEEVRASNEEPDDTVRVIKDGGYLGTLGVYHGLHCLRRIYWQLHEDVYFPNRTEERKAQEVEHAAHCLAVIIRDLTCKPDTSLYTFKYDPEDHPTPRLKSGAETRCMKWEPFHQWAGSRAPGYHPRVLAPENYLRKIRKEAANEAVNEVLEGPHYPEPIL